MKIYKRVLSFALSVILTALTFSAAALGVKAAENVGFSLSVSAESGNEITVAVSLVSGKFNSFDMELVTDSTVKTCSSIQTSDEYKQARDAIEDAGGVIVNASRAESKKIALSTTVPYSKTGPIFYVTFVKTSEAPVSAKNIVLKVNVCSQTSAGGEAFEITPSVKNLLPSLAGACGKNAYFVYNSASKELVIYGSGAMTDFASTTQVPWSSVMQEIASVKIEGAVSSVGNLAFSRAASLTAVSLSASVAKVGNGAFGNCSKLTAVSLSKVTSIGSGAFSGCSKLASVDLTAAASVGADAFKGCSALKTVKLSDKLTKINSKTFDGCSALEKLEVGKNVTDIAADAFNNCPKLVLVCWFGSAAYKTAVDQKIKFELLNSYIIGDVNDDGLINSQDALAVLRCSVGDLKFTSKQMKTGDVNNDGFVNSVDALYILEISIGNRDAVKYQR